MTSLRIEKKGSDAQLLPSYCLDTSVLNKHYHVEVGTADVDAIFANPNAQIYISCLPL